jgi:hypothetical protein
VSENRGPIGILGALKMPGLTEAEYNALLAEKLAGCTAELVELCDCDTWDCDCEE